LTDEEKHILLRLRVQARKNNQTCYSPGCVNLSIRSHIQQAEGPLRLIAKNGKVIQLELNNLFSTLRYKFKTVGIKDRHGDVLTFWGFCQECDFRTFQPIEKSSYNLYDYKNQLLHSYRGLLNELYKMDYNLKYHELVLNHENITDHTKSQFQRLKQEQMISSFFLKYFKELFEKDIVNGTKNFEFLIVKLPYIEVCTSAIFSAPSAIAVNEKLLNRIETGPTLKPPHSIVLFSVIPCESHTFCILGQPSDLSFPDRINLNKISKYSPKDKIKLVSDFLIKNVESWCISLELFHNWQKKKRDKQAIHEIQKHLPVHMKGRDIKFNLFKDFL
jgi:hypothetical protein